MHALLLGTLIYLILGIVSTIIVLVLYKTKAMSRVSAEFVFVLFVIFRAGVIICILSAVCMWMAWICMYMMQVRFNMFISLCTDEPIVSSHKEGCRVKCYSIF